MFAIKITNKITKVSRTLLQSNSETIANDKEISAERYIYPEERQKITDELRLILKYNNGIWKDNKFIR